MASKQKILIVDDDNNIAELISLYLTKECYDTKIVNDGEEAVREFHSFQPNLILLDLMLPGTYQVEYPAKMKIPGTTMETLDLIIDDLLEAKDLLAYHDTLYNATWRNNVWNNQATWFNNQYGNKCSIIARQRARKKGLTIRHRAGMVKKRRRLPCCIPSAPCWRA